MKSNSKAKYSQLHYILSLSPYLRLILAPPGTGTEHTEDQGIRAVREHTAAPRHHEEVCIAARLVYGVDAEFVVEPLDAAYCRRHIHTRYVSGVYSGVGVSISRRSSVLLLLSFPFFSSDVYCYVSSVSFLYVEMLASRRSAECTSLTTWVARANA